MDPAADKARVQVLCTIHVAYDAERLVTPDQIPDLTEIGELDEKVELIKRGGVCLSEVLVQKYSVTSDDGKTTFEVTSDFVFDCPNREVADRLVSALSEKDCVHESPIWFSLDFEGPDQTRWELGKFKPVTTCHIITQ
jgi:hypothetical protein